MTRANLIGWDNSAGLSADLLLLREILEHAGWAVDTNAEAPSPVSKEPHYDLNVMLEHIAPQHRPHARFNVMVPNPDWFRPRDQRQVMHMNALLLKTRHARALFEHMPAPLHHTGFTARDRLMPAVPRARTFFHLAGRSMSKGTQTVLRTWARHPSWPTLTVVQRPGHASACASAHNIRHRVEHLPDDILRRLQNQHLFHLCPSETEGFGHSLVEGMSVGAVVLCTDGPPMNELTTAERGIMLAAARTAQQRLATTYLVDEAALADGVERALALSSSECEARGRAARTWFVDNDRTFRPRLLEVLGKIMGDTPAR